MSLFAACALAVASQGGPACDGAPDPLRTPSFSVMGASVSSDLDNRFGQRATTRITRWEPLIAEASQRFVIPEAWIRAVMRAESGGRTMLDGQPITSSAGAMGLMQLMPGTFDDMRRRYGLGRDSYDPHDNILAGTAYLRQMYQQYGYPALFAAYHAGPGRFDGYLLQGQGLPPATLAYIGGIVPGVETMMVRPRLGPANSLWRISSRNLDSRAGAVNQTLFFVLNRSQIAQSSPLGEADLSSKTRHQSTTNSDPIGASAPPDRATPSSSLFVPLSQSHL